MRTGAAAPDTGVRVYPIASDPTATGARDLAQLATWRDAPMLAHGQRHG